MGGKLIDLIGRTYGRLTVTSRSTNSRHGGSRWNCACACGQRVVTAGGDMHSGRTKSCGCLVLKHGRSSTPEYRAWLSMRDRCSNQNHPQYANYGGRGITVCERWLSLELFLSDVGPRPTPKHSIDRIDNDGNYEPSNVRWSDRQTQSENRRSIQWITFGGRRMTHTQWGRALGGSATLVRARIAAGWSDEKAVTTPPIRQGRT